MKNKIFLLLLCAIALIGCRSTKQVIEKEHQEKEIRTDSVSLYVEKTTKVITTPQTTAKLNLTPKQIEELPIGASYEAKDGNATGTVRKTEDNNIEFAANCDSLTLLVEELSKEVYRLNNVNTELKTSLKKQKAVGLSGWEWFQIYGFRIYVILTFIYIGYRKWKK